MRLLTCISLMALLCVVAGCTVIQPPTPTPTPLPTSTPTPIPTSTPEPVGDYVPSAVPHCPGLKALDKPFPFNWAGVDVQSGADWYYYTCDLKPAGLAESFRGKMQNPPYNWLETGWVVRDEGTLGVYFHTARQEWLYLWFFENPGSPTTSRLVVGLVGLVPLDLPCCH